MAAKKPDNEHLPLSGMTPEKAMQRMFATPLPQKPMYCVQVPHWFLLGIVATLAPVPWIHWSKRFSLRTLLIATTLVAVVLGLVVYAARG